MLGNLLAHILIALVLLGVIMGCISYLILLERKTAAWIQDRVGPNRTGPKGLLQPMADGIKFILKEEFIPQNADKFLFLLAPVAIMTPALCSFAVIPFGGVLKAGSSFFGWHVNHPFSMMVSNPDVGVLFVLAMASLAVYGVVLAGWASGSKYSFLGGLRATAQMISYEIPLALALLCVAVTVGSMRLESICQTQAGYFTLLPFLPSWNIFTQPIAFLLFTTCIFAESNRAPFDLAECENELVGGYHTEYSSMKFALFFLAEYASMITGAAVAVTMFLGGWHLPWLDLLIYGHAQPAATGWGGVILKFVVFWFKMVLFIFFYMWVRWTLPRFRFDQLMRLAWRGMIPLALGAFLLSIGFVYLQQEGVIVHRLWLLVGNVILFVVMMGVLRLLPASQNNRRVAVPNSRYNPSPAGALVPEPIVA